MIRRDDRLLRIELRERFLVTLDSGETFEGLLEGTDLNHIVLINARLLGGDAPAPVDGQLFLPRLNVRYMQRP